MDLKQLMIKVRNEGGSEVHLKIGSAPLMRQQKFLKRLSLPAFVPQDMDALLKAVLTDDESKKVQSGAFFEKNIWGADPCNFSVNFFKIQGQTAAILRLLAPTIPSFDGMRLPAVMGQMIERKSGLLIISGPPRSGIMSTVAALVEMINKNQPAHVLIMQDQIEFVFEPKKARISQRQFKKDLVSFEAGINFAKRMDVDVLVIGDMKREPPFRAIFDYVNGGNFAILTMQTLGVQTTLEKLLGSFSADDQDYIAGVLSQDLIGVCSQALLVDPLEQKIVPVHETLVMNSPIRKIIQGGRANQIEFNFKSAGEGSALFETDVNRAVKEQKVSKEIGDSFMAWYKGMKG
jgi:twitching motility protein PilT